jgi:hypothetical protein
VNAQLRGPAYRETPQPTDEFLLRFEGLPLRQARMRAGQKDSVAARSLLTNTMQRTADVTRSMPVVHEAVTALPP